MAEDLVSRADYKKYVGISSNNEDAIIDILIPKVSQFVKNYCRRTFIDYTFDPKVEIFNGGSEYLILHEDPILAINSIEYSSNYGQNYTPLTQYTDWVLDGYLIRPVSRPSFSFSINGYRVTYRGGFEEVPEDVALAVMDLITYYRRNDGTVKSNKYTNTGSMTIEYISDMKLPSYIKRVLDNYIMDYT